LNSPLELLPNTYRAFFSGFSSLTAAQKQLIQPILKGEDVILQASTGAGKTEAVLAPATEKLMTHPGHFTIIYIVPTRALALDMHRRIKPIYEKLGLKSGIRTGDGKHHRDGKPHLLIMTPESLDVMLGSSNQDNKYFLNHVHMMIIDEVHVFLHDNRGHQLAYLHRRLAIQSSGSLQTVALSATIDNAEDVVQFFNLSKTPFYYKQSVARKLQPCWVHIEDEQRELPLLFNDLYRRSGCKKLLVFANSRKKCEQLYDILNQEGVFSQKVFLHYSNLSTKERKFIEASFRDGKIGVCIATSTLELGIDIGDVDGVVLMGPPPSTMAFLQRIGRSNRRQQYINFWGICYGHSAGMQLVRFLAFFELAKDHQVEKCLSSENYSVLFQQILSCLYAKKALSTDSLHLLFKEKLKDLPCIFQCMLANNWIKPTKQPGIYDGGWRYFSSLKRKQIWSNFPPTDEEYDVILEYEKIAVLPLSMVRQLEVGDLIRLTGKVLKILQIEEKKAALEVWVEESNEVASKELIWVGLGPPTPFEVAQKMGLILLDTFIPQGLLSRTRRLLEAEREKISRSLEQPNGIRVHRLGNGMYRYETFLGSGANFILYHLIERQLASKIEGLSVNFDEMGVECNEWIPFESLKIPHTFEQFREWVSSHLPLLKGGFSWNSWMHWLPEEQQLKEITSRLYDPRVLKHFQRYHAEPKWLPLPIHHVNVDKKIETNQIDLKGKPWSLENEKNAWGKLSFNLPSDEQNLSLTLTATQVQGYVTQKLCARWARFHQLDYHTEPHPRFSGIDQEIHSRRHQGITFKKEVIEALQHQGRVYFETAGLSDCGKSNCTSGLCQSPGVDVSKTIQYYNRGSFSIDQPRELSRSPDVQVNSAQSLTWQQAIRTVALDKKPLFLAQAKLKTEKLECSLSGSPDLIYIQHKGSHICLEVWDIKFSQSISYAQKWRIAFYTYLLEDLLKGETFSLPVKVSALGGLVYPSIDSEKQFEKAPFILAPYRAWMPRLIAQWKTDSGRSSAVQDYSMEFSCTTCRYFSYCYQEMLLTASPAPEKQTIAISRIISRNIESNDFPKNSKQWFFIHYDNESIQWQCWENGVSLKNVCIHSRDFPNEGVFQKEVASQLQKEWVLSVRQGKNPHLLVYESTDWHLFQKTFQSTALKSLWALHVSWTSIQTVLQTHFIWPIDGRITRMQVGACLGLAGCPIQPLSLYHRESFSNLETAFDLCRQIWNWCLSNVQSQRIVSFEGNKAHSVPLIQAYLAMHHRETECRMSDISEFQKNPLTERVKQFRAIGPIRFLGSNKEGCQFSVEAKTAVSKFRVGDFLKLSPVDNGQIQDGFSVVLETYSPERGLLSVRPLSQKVSFSRNQLYALDEDATDWNAPKTDRVLNLLKNPRFCPDVIQMLLGHTKHTKTLASDATHWIEQWYQSRAQAAGLNHCQKQALALPFREKIGLIEGPPGTGKTHLLVWTLIALVAHAKCLNRSIKILVTAQTHHAIDQILRKVAKTIPKANVSSFSLWKYGRFDEAQFSKLGIKQMQSSEVLYDASCLILGATGYGVYQLLENKNFPQLFDWVVFDESSQVLAPYALLSLIFGKGQALFYGDTQQMSPVLKGNYENTSFPPLSILKELISRYSAQNRLRLNETYRMNSDICKFASELWYDGELQSVVAEKDQILELPNYPLFRDYIDDYLDPSRSMVVVQLDHLGSQQSSQEEAEWIGKAVKRLIDDYSIASEQIGIISPHRLQNNTILSALKEALPFSLKLPRVDTVERMQGSEFDIVIFSATVSDKEMIHSHFLKDYRRFNVALTRARKKFILVASALFFQTFPTTEKDLIAQMPFENLAYPPGERFFVSHDYP
jgi:superfamily II DNA/RNA helicase